MENKCKDFQMKLLLSQFSEDLLQHLAGCECCWEAFMNIGLENQVKEDLLTNSKKNLFDKAEKMTNQGDNIMERFHLLSSLSFTPHARKVFLDYFAHLETYKSQTTQNWPVVLGRLEDVLYASLQKKLKETKTPQEPVNAEIMLDALGELGEPQVFLKTLETQGEVVAGAPEKYRRIFRSQGDKFIAGVCGGLGEYFRIDPVLLRILFVALFFSGGWPVLLYIALWYILPIKPQAIISGKEKQPVAEKAPRIKTVVRRLVLWGVSLFLFIVAYIPLTVALAAVSIASAVALFTPIIGDESFFISLGQLGIPGIIGGCAVSLLFFSLFVLVVSFVSRLHFKANLLGKNVSAILIVLVIMSIFSILVAGGVLLNENKAGATITVTKEFAVPQGEQIFRWSKENPYKFSASDIPIKSVSIQGQPNAKQITVQAILNARGGNIDLATRYASAVNTVWSDKASEYLPRFEKKDKIFHCESAELVVIVPSTMGLELNGVPAHRAHVEGIQGESVAVESRHAGLFLQNIQTKLMQIKNEMGFVDGSKLTCEAFNLTNKLGHIRLSQVQSQQLEITNSKGSVSIMDVAGSLKVQNEYGLVRLKIRDYPATTESKLENKHGTMLLYFLKDKIPTCKIDRSHGHIENFLPQDAKDSETIFSIRLHSGRLRLGTWNPDRSAHAADFTIPKDEARGNTPPREEDAE